MRLIRLTIAVTITALLVIVTGPSQAGPPALPALPSAAVLNSVIAQSSGPTFTPLGIPASVIPALTQFGGVFDGVENRVSESDAISYLGTGGILKETVLPLKNSGSHTLTANITAPGANPLPGKVVGALYQPYRGTMVLVSVFRNGRPDRLRMYTTNTQYQEYNVTVDKFKSRTANSYDEGAIIGQALSCVTVGLSQVCWPPTNPAVREQGHPQNVVSAAYNRAKSAYQLTVNFFLTDAVPDLIGKQKRAGCDAAFNTLTGPVQNLTACDPNLYVTAARQQKAGQPIALWVVDEKADLKGFTYNGVYLGYIPAGEYLVMNATPNVTTPGQTGVLMLVNINDKNKHYLIPSVRMQQYAQPLQLPVASIKDGCTWYYGW